MANQVTSADGQKLTVKYQEGEKIIIVPPTAEIVTYKKAAADLKPGQKIFVAAAKKLPDGTLEAPNVAFGDYGVWRSARTGIGTPSTSHRAPPFENAALRPLVKALVYDFHSPKRAGKSGH